MYALDDVAGRSSIGFSGDPGRDSRSDVVYFSRGSTRSVRDRMRRPEGSGVVEAHLPRFATERAGGPLAILFLCAIPATDREQMVGKFRGRYGRRRTPRRGERGASRGRSRAGDHRRRGDVEPDPDVDTTPEDVTKSNAADTIVVPSRGDANAGFGTTVGTDGEA